MTPRVAIDDAIASLKDRFGERLSLAAPVREQHGKDFSYHQPFPPDAVVFAQSTDEVLAIVATCARHGVPVIPYGTGTSLEGQIAAVKGGIASFSRGLARSVAPQVRVNVLAPGWIETAFGQGIDSGTYNSVADSTPLRRWGTPDDVAGAAVFLASPAAAFITGQTIMIGGGVVMG